MPTRFRTRFALCFSIGASLLLSACQPAASVAQLAPANTAVPTVQIVATVAPSATNTRVPDTPTTVPSSTATTRPADTATTPPTATTKPTVAPTNTVPPTVAPTATRKATARPTLPPQPTATKAPVVAASVYSTFSGGPQGYKSTLGCTQAGGAPCQPVMAPGDVAFSIRLESGMDAVLAIFVPFGLSVEKDGANVADMYMTVVSGWLNPGEYALLGTSRNFSQPGHYVIHTNGCLLTEASYPNCSWGTVDGTVVTFDIQ
jgi:hypothetical protein